MIEFVEIIDILGITSGQAFIAQNVLKMKVINEVVVCDKDFCIKNINPIVNKDFPIISKLYCKEVIEEFILEERRI
jgi:hypothetical protein